MREYMSSVDNMQMITKYMNVSVPQSQGHKLPQEPTPTIELQIIF